MYGIILAGGSGSRLWPISRELYPKQLLNLNSDKSLLQATFERLKTFIPEQYIINITNTKHSSNVRIQLSELTKSPVILSEPVAKNTAPAIAACTKYIIQTTNSDPIILVAPSDQIINNIEKFQDSVKKGEKLAQEGYLVTFGIEPTYPETGFGYINTGDKIAEGFKVKEFVEKPELEIAKKFINEGTYFWNSGIFMFKASTFLQEAEKHAPNIMQIINEIDFSKSNEIPFVTFDKMPNISFDYAVMEKSDNIALVKLESDWVDLGSWNSIYDISNKDKDGNVFVGHVLDKNSKNSFVYASSKLVATIGLEDMIDNTHLIHKTVYRPWGFYTVIAQGKGFMTKIIHVNPRQKLSLQSHNFRSEHWVVLTGKAKVILEGQDLILSPGHSIDIPLKAIHSLQNPFEEDLEVIEVQKGDPLIEEDIIRYEDIYGRV